MRLSTLTGLVTATYLALTVPGCATVNQNVQENYGIPERIEVVETYPGKPVRAFPGQDMPKPVATTIGCIDTNYYDPEENDLSPLAAAYVEALDCKECGIDYSSYCRGEQRVQRKAIVIDNVTHKEQGLDANINRESLAGMGITCISYSSVEYTLMNNGMLCARISIMDDWFNCSDVQ
jgi:hypothetical protein